MTCVSGHLTDAYFDAEYEKDWENPPPEALFQAPVRVSVKKVGFPKEVVDHITNLMYRAMNLLQRIYNRMHEGLELFSSGPIAISKANILVVRFEQKL
jgi:hypothetical protein